MFAKTALPEVGLCEIGLCVGTYRSSDGRRGVYLLFGGGFFDGFSLKELEEFVRPTLISYPIYADYEFVSALRVLDDFERGCFSEALPDVLDHNRPLPWFVFELIMRDWGLSLESMGKLLGVPWATLRTWKARDDIPANIAYQIEALQLVSAIRFRAVGRRRGVRLARCRVVANPHSSAATGAA